MSNEAMHKVLWWVCLFLAPLVLVTIELFHPAGFTASPGAWEYLSKPEPYNPQYQALAYPGPQWWFALHMIQTPMVALVAVGLWLMVQRVESGDGSIAVFLAWLARLATFVFLIYYTALDSIGGFGLGRTILLTQRYQLPKEQLDPVIKVINGAWSDCWVGGVHSFVSLTGSWAAFAAAVLVAVALGLAHKASWIPLLLLVAFGWELQMSHTMPYGPIAFSLLIVSALWMWVAERRQKNIKAVAAD
jgi:hypothetical protein